MMHRMVMRSRLLPLALLGSLGLFLAAPARAAVWSMLGKARTHSSTSNFLGPNTNELAWRFDAQGPVRGGVAIDTDGTIFVGAKNQLFAVEQNGTKRWNVRGLGRLVGVPAIGTNGHLYVAAASGKIYAIDAKTGTRIWSFAMDPPITTSVVLSIDGTLYFGAGQGGVVAVAPDGTKRWQALIGKVANSAPAISADGTLFVGTSTGRVVAIDPSGAVRWEARAAQAKKLGTPVLSATGRIYVGGRTGGVVALDATSGAVLWSHAVPAAVGGLALGPNNTIVFGAQDARVYALHDDDLSPTVLWTTRLNKKVSSTPAIDRAGAVYLGADDGQVYALEASSGAIRWSLATQKPVRSALALGIGGRVFAGSDDRGLYAIGELRTGESCWNEAFLDEEGLSPEDADRRFQILLAACGGPGVDSCTATVQGTVNADLVVAANRVHAREIDPATYLAILRDRTHKLVHLRQSGGLCQVAQADADSDLVPDTNDSCADTPPLTPTFDNGCPNPTLPEAPPADLFYRFIDQFVVAFDPHCDTTVPVVPRLSLRLAVGVFTPPYVQEFLIALDTPNNQAPGCGIWYELEAFVMWPDGTWHTGYIVLPRTQGFVTPQLPNSLLFGVHLTDPSPYSDFVRSGVFALNNETRIRVRATNFRGVRSAWSSIFSCRNDCYLQ